MKEINILGTHYFRGNCSLLKWLKYIVMDILGKNRTSPKFDKKKSKYNYRIYK